MAEAFNPYHVWLGIPPQELPANFYRLLGVPLLEANPDVIDNAADQRTAHLRTFQSGKHGKDAERLLNEVAAARVCLLDPQKKAAYDQRVRAWLAAQQARAASAAARTAPQQGAAQPSAAQPSAGDWDNLLGDVEGKPKKPVGSKQKAKQRPVAIFAVAGVLLAAAAGIGIYALTSGSADGTLVLDWPAEQRTGATLTIDGAPATIPPSGVVEFPSPPGEHRLAATRPLYQPWSRAVTVAAGERQAVPMVWKPKAVVALDWPVNDRKGATLKVDGIIQAVSDHEPLELLVEPGDHTIRILRPTGDPVQTGVQVALDGRRTIAIAPAAVDTTLLVQWPAADRAGGHLIIDGAVPTLAKSSSATLEFTLKTGRHTVRVTRPGFQPIEQTVDLAAADNKPLVPTWTPDVATNTQPTTPDVAVTPTPGPSESAPVKKQPVPTAEEQAKIAKQLDELYKPTHTTVDAAKASEFYDLSDKAQSPAERFMLLARGADLAAGAGDVALAFSGVDLLAAEYEIEPFDAKQKLLEKGVAAATTADQLTALITAAEPLLDQAIAADQYAAAMSIAATASKALGKRPVDAQLRKDTDDLLARRRRDIRILEPLYAVAQKAQKTLESSPDDAEANLTVGRWYCLYKNDWPRGLPLLAKGKDEKLKAEALAELKPPATTDEQVQAADLWWDVSQKELGLARDAIRLHAGDLYTAALPGLTSPLAKVKIDKRLAEIADLQHPAAARHPANAIAMRLEGMYVIANKHDGRCLAISGARKNPGDTALVWKPSGGAEQVWNLVPAPDGAFDLVNKNSGEYLSVRQGSKDAGADVLQWSQTSGNGQHWVVEPTRRGFVKIVNKYSGLCLGVRAGDGQSIEQEQYQNLDTQQWKLTPNGPPPSAPSRSVALPLGQWVDVLKLVDTNRNAVKGTWSRNGAEIVCDDPGSGDLARIELPVEIDGGYDLEIEFTRTNGNGSINPLIPVGSQRCVVVLNGYKSSPSETDSGLEFIDGHEFNDPRNPTDRRPGTLESGRRYRVTVRVRILPGDQASIDVALDGKPYLTHWSGGTSSLGSRSEWSLPGPKRLGLGVCLGRVVFHAARLRMIFGQATSDAAPAKIDGTAPSSGESLPGASGKFVKLVDIKPVSTHVSYGVFRINQPAIGDEAPQVSRDFKLCDEYIFAHAPSRLTYTLPPGTRSFAAIGYCVANRHVAFEVVADGRSLYKSGPAGIAPIAVDLPRGTAKLELVIDDLGNNSDAHSFWCVPRLYSGDNAKGKPTLITDLKPVAAEAWQNDISVNHLPDEGVTPPLDAASARPCNEFLFAHADSELTYEVPEGAVRFSAIGYCGQRAGLTFRVRGDGNVLYESPKAGIAPVDVQIPKGTTILGLEVDCHGNGNSAHTYWCYPRFYIEAAPANGPAKAEN